MDKIISAIKAFLESKTTTKETKMPSYDLDFEHWWYMENQDSIGYAPFTDPKLAAWAAWNAATEQANKPKTTLNPLRLGCIQIKARLYPDNRLQLIAEKPLQYETIKLSIEQGLKVEAVTAYPNVRLVDNNKSE